MTGKRAKLDFSHDGQVARVNLDEPRANIVDLAMMADLSAALEEIAERRDLLAVILGAEGPNFSFGASVPEHLPDSIGEALAQLNGLVHRLLEAPAPTIAAVRGQCLGGGFELVLACDLILAEETARLGVPEIKLGVFPPAASALLPARLGAGRATALILSGETVSGRHAAEMGLVTRTALDGDLDVALNSWLGEEFIGRSPVGLRHGARATRRPLIRAAQDELAALERQYLEELMAEPDAVEGIKAFLEKREPNWGRSGDEL